MLYLGQHTKFSLIRLWSSEKLLFVVAMKSLLLLSMHVSKTMLVSGQIVVVLF